VWSRGRGAEARPPVPAPQRPATSIPPQPSERPAPAPLKTTLPAPSNRAVVDLEVATRVEAAYREASAGNLDAALSAARGAVEYAPLHAAPYFALAVFEVEQGRHDEAETLLRRVLYLEPAHAEAHYRLGLLCLRRDEVVAARRSFFNALRCEQQSGAASSLLAAAIGAQLAHLERAK
ncbi:MAG TPA: tetratricopeptide repeat protein, partial [Polyangiaceae bacterium]|nr:tetratricopeptide repeat protein [Polyangiaceae bacterium]